MGVLLTMLKFAIILIVYVRALKKHKEFD